MKKGSFVVACIFFAVSVIACVFGAIMAFNSLGTISTDSSEEAVASVFAFILLFGVSIIADIIQLIATFISFPLFVSYFKCESKGLKIASIVMGIILLVLLAVSIAIIVYAIGHIGRMGNTEETARAMYCLLCKQ